MVSGFKGARIVASAAALALTAQLGAVALSPGADALNGTVAATTRVHVRSEPTTKSRSLTILSPGQTVQAHGTTSGWTKVTWNGKTAYVYSKYLTLKNDDRIIDNGPTGPARTTANLNIRSGASTQGRVIAVARKGTTVTLTGRVSGAYSQVKWQGADRWAATRYLTVAPRNPNTPPATGSVQTTANLNMREGSSTRHRSAGIAPRGTVLATTGKIENGFQQVVWQGNSRWASTQYLRQVNENPGTPPRDPADPPRTQQRWATADLNVWLSSTSTQYNEVLPRGSELAVTGTIQNGRAEIVHKGARRWVTARYTSTTPPNNQNPPSEPPPNEIGPEPIKGGPRGRDLNRGYSRGLERVNPQMQRVAADVWARFPQIKTMYGWRQDTTPDHPAGRAIDVMIPGYKTEAGNKLGWEIALYYKKWADELGIKYIIFDQKIWNKERDAEGWRMMKSRGNDTANHLDHVHINSW